MGKGSKAQTVGYWYSFSILMGACRGPINALRSINVGELRAWDGEATDNTEFDLSKANLFGGPEKEGGIDGRFGVFMGSALQTFSSAFKSLMGGLVPDFRGVTTFTFRGRISANNPYPKPWAFRVARWDAGWDRDGAWYAVKARILLDDGQGGTIYAMNPAHILYECYTDRLWGRGHDPSALMEDYFISAANTLCDEGFGLCIKWLRTGDIDEFINMVMNHIGCVQIVDRETGRIGIRLIRNDYNPEDLPIFGYNTGLLDIKEDETAAGDSAFSEVVVNYIDARSGEKAVAREQSLAVMQALGDIASTTAAYEGLPTAALAHRVAARDLNQQAAFLKRFRVVLDRRGWQLQPGMVFKVTATDRGLTEIILRVGSIEDTELKDGRINITAVQDVFGLPTTGYTTPTLPGAWMPPDNTAYAVSEYRIEEATYRDLVRSIPPAELAAVDETDGYLSVLAAPPTGLSIEYDIATAAPGETILVRGSGDWTPSAALIAGVGHYDTTLIFTEDSDLSSALPGESIQVADEIMGVVSVDNDAKTMTVTRGTVDSLPAPHAAMARVWFSQDAVGSDNRPYTVTETVAVRLLTRTASSALDINDAPEHTITIGARQSRPYPPGALTVNGNPFGDIEFEVAAGEVELEWAHRDRVLQSDQLVEHEAGSVGPEAGTTYTVRVYDGTSMLRETTGIAGTGWTYDSAMIATDGEPTEEAWTFEIESVRDGLASWFTYSFPVNRRLSRELEIAGPAIIHLSGVRPTIAASWTFNPAPSSIRVVGQRPTLSM